MLLVAAVAGAVAVIFGYWGTWTAGKEADEVADNRAKSAENAANNRATNAEEAADKRAKIAEDKANAQIEALKEVKALQDGGESYPEFELSALAHDLNRLNLMLTVNGKYDMHAVNVMVRDNLLLGKLNAQGSQDVDSLTMNQAKSDRMLPIPDGYLKAGTARIFENRVTPDTNSISWSAYVDAKNGHWLVHIMAHRIAGMWRYNVTLQGTFVVGEKVLRRSDGFPAEGLNSLRYEIKK